MVILREDCPDVPKINRTKGLLLFLSGVTLLTIALLSFLLDPITALVRYNTRLANNSFFFNTFKSEVQGAKISVFIFNITNGERFLTGADHKLKLAEVGPFTYIEVRQNKDVYLDTEKGLISFTPHMKLKFLPDESIGRPEDVQVTVPNVPLMSATAMLSSYPYLVKQAFNFLIYPYHFKPLKVISVYDFLWGVEDQLLRLANTVVPGLIYFKKFGIIERLYDNQTMYRMEISARDEDRFSIKTLKKYMINKNWNDSLPLESYRFNNTYEGLGYPAHMSRGAPLSVYRAGLCRPLRLQLRGAARMDYGPEGWLYGISDGTFEDCQNGVCGLMDLSKCTYGVPIVISRTHFLFADPKLYERIDGIHPDPKKHDSVFILEPKMGVELATDLSLQLNLALGDVTFNRNVASFSNMVLPIVHLHVVQEEMFEEMKYYMRMLHIVAPNVLLALEIIFIAVGLSLVAIAIRIVIVDWLVAKQNDSLKKSKTKQMVPLLIVTNNYDNDLIAEKKLKQLCLASDKPINSL